MNPLPPLYPTSRWLRPGWWWFCLLALGGAIFWAHRVVSEYPTPEQRALVPLSTVWGLHACALVGLTAFAVLAAPLARWLGRRHLLTAASLGLLAFFATDLAPKTNRIFYDEHIYMQIGQTLARTGRAEYAQYARIEYGDLTVFESWVNKQPNGHPYLLSWAYRLFGASEQVSHVTIQVVVGLTAAVLYLALVLLPLTLPAGAPIAVTLCFIFTPVVLWWGHTVAVEPTASGTAILVFFATCLHARWRDPATGESSPITGALLAATAAFAACFRPESLLVFPVAAALLWGADRRFLEDRSTWAALALALALLTPNLLHLWSVRTEDWGATDGRRFDFDFLAKNLASNGGYFFTGKWYPLGGTLLAFAGAAWLALRNRGLGLALAIWFAIGWGIFVLFYAGGYYYGASSRYAVVSAAPVALFAGIGLTALAAWLRRWPIAIAALGVAVALNWIAALHFVPTLGRESNEARADIAFDREMAARLPSGSLVISNDPCVWNLLGRNSAQFGSVENLVRHDLRELARQYPGGIYLHWDYWVNCSPQLAGTWRQLILDTHATLFARQNAEDAKLALFRLDTAPALEAMGGRAEPAKPRLDPEVVAAEALAQPPAPPPAAPPP